ncbi:DUF2239 family protein [Limoniibacter endophyticus]|uniref:DUF2239 family protein n=1 Tax=Limoniibacter endophyticus TaxID=1565040 RepID=A0A8J3DN18_9HYPH|nr:DUF2239 family protein [Limoniibacter endophyticus]GHC72828.1 hypothetical protein GCM10010136_20810 [Limoniibacter endophyticus]
MEPTRIFSAFSGQKLLKRGTAQTVAAAMKRALENQRDVNFAIFDDKTGRRLDVPVAETEEDLASIIREAAMPSRPRAPGRPRLGVVAREVTLLPQQWAWLNEQEGGASVTLRRLVDNARSKADEDKRNAQAASSRFMADMLADQENYIEACAALSNANRAQFIELTRNWPMDLRDHVRLLAEPAFQPVR